MTVTPLPTAAATLPVAETFTTYQGEGPATGQPAHFLRLGGCNLSCSWCDTPYTWDGQAYDLRHEFTSYTADQLAATVGADLVVLTGGEPLLHQDNPAFVELLNRVDTHAVHVETNGTRAPTDHTAGVVDLFVVSPKLDHSGPHRGTQDPTPADCWPELVDQAVLKVVCRDRGDIDAAADLASDWCFPPEQVWIMPEGTDTATLAARGRQLADYALEHRFNLSMRLHVLLWGTERNR